VKVEIESKNRLVAFLKFLVAMQYKPSYTFNRFFLSQSPPSSNNLQSVTKWSNTITLMVQNGRMELYKQNRGLLLCLINGF
jgi:hypothetical protein